MTSLINKIEQLIKREKTTPERQNKDDCKKTSAELLTELFGVFNADPPKISDKSKKSKKSKKKHKKEKKKRTRSVSEDSDGSDRHKHKKRKKSKSKKRKRSVSVASSGIRTPPSHPLNSIDVKTPVIKSEKEIKVEIKKEEKCDEVPIKTENIPLPMDASLIPMPDSPESEDAKHSTENDKGKNKIQIKNLKFSTVFEETVKQAEAAAKKKAELYEEGEYTDSSSNTDKEEPINSEFPKSSDLGGILKKPEDKINENKNKSKDSKTDSSRKSPRKRSRERSKSKRSRSRSRKRHSSKSRHESSSKRRRSKSRRRSSEKKRSGSRSRRRSTSRSRRRSTSRTRTSRSRHSPRHGRLRSPTGVRLADSEKKRLLEVARRNAINMLKNGAVPAGAAALPPHTRNQVMAAIHSGGKSVDELTDFCKHLSKKEALGELSSVSEDDGMSENEDTLAFHHPFLVKEKAPIVMNIRGGAPLPIKSTSTVNKEELRIQFPVSSGNEHRESQWTPVDPPNDKDKDNLQVAKINHKHTKTTPSTTLAEKPSTPLALPAVEATPTPAPVPAVALKYMNNFKSGNELSSIPALPPPGPQAYPPGVDRPRDITAVIAEKLSAIRREQERIELKAISYPGYGGWPRNSGQFTGSTGAQILTPRELASGTQAWAKKDQLTRAAPVAGGMGMTLLQKMGWTPGQGLGKEGTGTLQPLLLEVKLDTRGLQSKEETHKRGVKSGRSMNMRRSAPTSSSGSKHPVSLLGEYCSKQKVGPPEYNLCFECGPDHKKNFLFKVKVAGTEYQPAVASANKKQAKLDAAKLALEKLGINVP